SDPRRQASRPDAAGPPRRRRCGRRRRARGRAQGGSSSRESTPDLTCPEDPGTSGTRRCGMAVRSREKGPGHRAVVTSEGLKAGVAGKVAAVIGASRGGGRGIAVALGDAGATVYVAGRTTRDGSKPADGAPGTIDDTAEEVTRRGGRGIPVRADGLR